MANMRIPRKKWMSAISLSVNLGAGARPAARFSQLDHRSHRKCGFRVRMSPRLSHDGMAQRVRAKRALLSAFFSVKASGFHIAGMPDQAFSHP